MNGRKRWFRMGPATVALLAIAAVLYAYPIPPKTLWDLVQDSELVVLARVEEKGEVVRRHSSSKVVPSSPS